MIVIGNLGSAAMLVLLAFIGNPWIMAIALLAYGAISSMSTPAVAAYVSDVVPFRKQKRVFAADVGREFRLRDRPDHRQPVGEDLLCADVLRGSRGAGVRHDLDDRVLQGSRAGQAPAGRGRAGAGVASRGISCGNAVEHAVKQTGESQRPQRFSV